MTSIIWRSIVTNVGDIIVFLQTLNRKDTGFINHLARQQTIATSKNKKIHPKAVDCWYRQHYKRINKVIVGQAKHLKISEDELLDMLANLGYQRIRQPKRSKV